jgi:Flp pilus assembly protein TadG
MHRPAIGSRIRALLTRFRTSNDGNIAIIFAVVLVPMIGFIGAAVDYSRANSARTAMQTALDSAALMVAKDNATGGLTTAELTTRATAYFKALYTNTDASNLTVTATYTKNAILGSTIVLGGSGGVATSFMKIAGFNTLNVNTASTVTWGLTKLRVALALDNTGSMQSDGKIAALRTATANLIDQLSASAKEDGDVYISMVPFANEVNFGTAYKNSGYVDYSGWGTKGSFYDGWTCGSKYNASNEVQLCGSTNNNINSWNGCVMDRGTSTPPGANSGPDVLVTAPGATATNYPADQSSTCPQAITPLSYNWSTLKSAAAAMQPLGGTNQPIGLVWAWQTLQQTAPFNAPTEDSNYTYKKAIILLSDGDNTLDRWYGNGQSGSGAKIDVRQKLLCDNVKAAGITIYAIQVNTDTKTPDPTSAVLQYCASGTANFFQLTTASQVISTFNSIGASLSDLRVSN